MPSVHLFRVLCVACAAWTRFASSDGDPHRLLCGWLFGGSGTSSPTFCFRKNFRNLGENGSHAALLLSTFPTLTRSWLLFAAPHMMVRTLKVTINNLGIGRDVDETLRLIQAHQFLAKHGEVGAWVARWVTRQLELQFVQHAGILTLVAVSLCQRSHVDSIGYSSIWRVSRQILCCVLNTCCG